MTLNNGSMAEARGEDRGMTTLTLTLSEDRAKSFFALLEQGVELEATLPAPLRALLCDQLGVDPQYVDERINTIFLDGKAVDRPDSALAHPGSVLALSASMPGFVGAAFRKSGRYALMRGALSHVEREDREAPERGLFTLKLFNMTCKELGPGILKRGAVVAVENLERIVAGLPESFEQGCVACELDGAPLPPASLRATDLAAKADRVFLRVVSGS